MAILDVKSILFTACWACSAHSVEAVFELIDETPNVSPTKIPRLVELAFSSFQANESFSVAARYIWRELSKSICIKQTKQHKPWNPYRWIIYDRYNVFDTYYDLCHIYTSVLLSRYSEPPTNSLEIKSSCEKILLSQSRAMHGGKSGQCLGRVFLFVAWLHKT